MTLPEDSLVMPDPPRRFWASMICAVLLVGTIWALGCESSGGRIPIAVLGTNPVLNASDTTSIASSTTSGAGGSSSTSGTSDSASTTRITGVVRHATSREPMSGISVKLLANTASGTELGSTFTSGEGKYFFENQKEGLYFLRFFHTDLTKFDPATTVVSILKDGTISPPSADVDLIPSTPTEKAFTILGRVLDGYSGGALDYVTCSLKETGSIMSDYLGAYFFENILPGTYHLEFSKLGYNGLSVNVRVRLDGTTFPATLTYRLAQNQEGNKGSLVGRISNEGIVNQKGWPNLIVRVYRMERYPDTVPEIWEIVFPFLKSTRTADDYLVTQGYAEEGTFKITHLEPTDENHKYLVYVGTGISGVMPKSGGTVGSHSIVIEDTDNNPARVFSLQRVEVKANTSTYIANYDLP